jgi:hypothetical protein
MCIVDAFGAAVVGVTLGVLGITGAHVPRSIEKIIVFIR